jgi:3-methyl-2-oxobutanoate hydroxymethyltransferase
MPFGSYEASPEAAHAAAVRVMQETGCQAIKVESGKVIADTIAYLAERGIPVMGHVGLRPQAVHMDGGFKTKGRQQPERDRVIAEAKAAEQAGAFAIVIEGVARDLADEITRQVAVPTIGIGASPDCDGQVLVLDDMLGLFDWTPKFVRRYANLRETISRAVATYADDVRAGRFPDKAEVYTLPLKK